jgi:transmembrane sensor
MDERLIKYVIGEATPLEQEQVHAWLKENKSNEKRLSHFRLIWETSKTLQAESSLDQETAWLEFVQLRNRQKTGNHHQVKELYADHSGSDLLDHHSGIANKGIYPDAGHAPLVHKMETGIPLKMMQIAAVCILVSGLAFLLYSKLYPAKPELLTLQSHDTVKTDTLSDGSVIVLNKNSVAQCPQQFTGSTREIRLISGEAFFNIVHNRKKAFIVHINDATVKVLGTSFNIRKNKEKAEVIVETGIVEVSRKRVVLKLRPTEKADIYYHTDELKKGITTDRFYNYYRTKEFVANKTPLWRIVQVLNDVYKVDIRVPDRALANRQLTTTLRLGSLDPILNHLAIAFNARIVHEADHIIIR